MALAHLSRCVILWAIKPAEALAGPERPGTLAQGVLSNSCGVAWPLGHSLEPNCRVQTLVLALHDLGTDFALWPGCGQQQCPPLSGIPGVGSECVESSGNSAWHIPSALFTN